ncbi:MAG: hypothetical protein Q9208_006850 [Pyrenodesmia sp. 3 TL-2023]
MEDEVDVLICGAGPVGLLIAYCLARYHVSTSVVEQHDKIKQTMYGRAAMFAPRSLEMLDRLDITDALGQIGFVFRGQKYYQEGKMVEHLSTPMTGVEGTFYDYGLICRQRFTEAAIREPTPGLVGTKSTITRRKYLIGADGGSSTVRSLAGIAFPGERNSRYWVRIDGRVRTDMPSARSFCGLNSPTHGSILWAPLDHSSTRVGFALPPKVWEQHGRGITQETVMAQAVEALHPFSLEFDSVEWWTVYSVGQRLAESYCAKERIFLAGDAAHTHSSGAGQGMNTGLHDAVNLSWKLAGGIKGYFTPDVLASYEQERRPVAQNIIEQDRLISVLVGGEIPEALRAEGKDAPTLLAEVYRRNVKLNTGLGIEYEVDGTVNVAPCEDLKIGLRAGSRAPDVLVQRPGPRVPVRLLSLIKNEAVRIKKLRDYLDGEEGLTSRYSPALFGFLTLIAKANDNGAAEEIIGCPGFGNMLYDADGSAHESYGIEKSQGAVVILRPDGAMGTAVRLEDGKRMGMYFDGFLKKGRDIDEAVGIRVDGELANGRVEDEVVDEGAMGEVEVEVGAV